MASNLKFLSGCPDGLPLAVTATTSGTAQTLHDATSAAGKADLAVVFGFNNTATARRLSLLIGSIEINKVLPAYSGLIPMFEDSPVRAAVDIKVFGEVATGLGVCGKILQGDYTP